MTLQNAPIYVVEDDAAVGDPAIVTLCEAALSGLA
eukprot:CAMPEP_0185597252 /NCGR_PEP_ID=MMETSP0434-20130131/81248_1 /TAXON_ID=626734 ORGANISM="Favella taraikaensis, Strain Fe Narragansett Bay" /NCGR_SAMPLE_ID=MMETSP0434 /ASSEMBLY_ACC=CAM_ASM_000379 /LENGTH=34 /DNA_ID= /DNA_START= /DNA_END= /DNA_ORIENTATION=